MHRDALLYDFPLVIASAVVPRKFFGKISEEGNFRIFLENSENSEKYPLPKNTRFTVTMQSVDPNTTYSAYH